MNNAVIVPPEAFAFSIFSSALCLAILIHVFSIQVAQFKIKTALQPLKYRMAGLIFSLILANGIILAFSVYAFGKPVTSTFLAALSIVNRIIAIITTLLVYFIYHFQVKSASPTGKRRRKTDIL